MTPEEHFARFEEADRRLQERHEALAQTVEIIASMQQANEKQI